MNEKEFNKYLKGLKVDKKAFDQLYFYYFPKIVLNIYFMYKDYGLGEDVAQEFFIMLLQKQEFDHVNFPNKWVFTVTENLAKNKIAKMISDRENEHEYVSTQYLIAATKNDPVEVALLGDFIEAIKRLDEITRQIIKMKIFEGYEFNEIAEKMGISNATARQRFARGMKKLRKEHRMEDFM